MVRSADVYGGLLSIPAIFGDMVSSISGFPQPNTTGKSAAELFGKPTWSKTFGPIIEPNKYSHYRYENAKFDVRRTISVNGGYPWESDSLFRRWETQFRSCRADCIEDISLNKCDLVEVRAGNKGFLEMWTKYKITPK